MSYLKLGVMATTSKENERRLPLHPTHINRIDPDLREHIYLERGYAKDFGVSDTQLEGSVAGMRSRQDLIDECDVILLLKPAAEDLAELRTGQVLWGWPHCVQDERLTQNAVERRQTIIAFEAMQHWSRQGAFKLHVFHKNNEMAGYCSVLHALQIVGSTGTYGRRLRAVVIGFGATSRGAITALNAHGVHDIDILTQRGVAAVASPIHSAQIVHFDYGDSKPGEPSTGYALCDQGKVPLAEFLAEHDVVVNCVLQDTDAPLTFLVEEDLSAFEPGSLIIDVSCDEAMGFSWARPTSFDRPTFEVGKNLTYYAVDHSPSYLWNSATWEISEAVLPFLRTVLGGPQAWDDDPSIRRAIEIRDGTILNPNILSFQRRHDQYPHHRLGSSNTAGATSI